MVAPKILLCGIIVFTARLAATAAAVWVIRYAGTFFQGKRLASAKAVVTAGLKCAPDCDPKV